MFLVSGLAINYPSSLVCVTAQSGREARLSSYDTVNCSKNIRIITLLLWATSVKVFWRNLWPYKPCAFSNAALDLPLIPSLLTLTHNAAKYRPLGTMGSVLSETKVAIAREDTMMHTNWLWEK